jgi:hypothetical protein
MAQIQRSLRRSTFALLQRGTWNPQNVPADADAAFTSSFSTLLTQQHNPVTMDKKRNYSSNIPEYWGRDSPYHSHPTFLRLMRQNPRHHHVVWYQSFIIKCHLGLCHPWRTERQVLCYLLELELLDGLRCLWETWPQPLHPSRKHIHSWWYQPSLPFHFLCYIIIWVDWDICIGIITSMGISLRGILHWSIRGWSRAVKCCWWVEA